MSYDVIFFDLDHTLVDTRLQYRLGLQAAIDEMFGGDVPAGFQDRFMKHHEQLWTLYDKRQITMTDVRRQRFIRAWQDYGVTKSEEEAEQFYQVYHSTLSKTLFAYEGVVDMLTALKQTHRLGIITNGAADLQWKKLEYTGLVPFFIPESVIISELIGPSKPHSAVYRAACDAMDTAPDKSLMIGDNYNNDVLGARVFGMDAVWFIPDPDMFQEARQLGVSEQPVASATQLTQQIALLERPSHRQS